MSPLLSTLFLSTVFSGTVVVLLSSHWFFIWVGLEINTLAFLPLMAKPSQPRSTEATTKYFLIQATASAFILLASLIQAHTTGSWATTETMTPLAEILFIFAIMVKMAVAPCHWWLPDVLQGVSLTTGLLMSTWQKLAPITILLTLNPTTPTMAFLLMGSLSVFVGGCGGLNQTQTRKLLAFSSISHMGWVLVIFPFWPQLTIFYLLIYFIITSSFMIMLQKNSSLSLQDLTKLINSNPWLAVALLIIMLSLGGLPPLTGFLAKWLVLQQLMFSNTFIITSVLLFSTLLSLFFYLRMAYMATLTLSPQHTLSILSWRTTTLSVKNNITLAVLLMSSTMGLIMAPTITPLIF
uniref:NADH-ubiquinone oxidoreductase chain 2 n=1 Tax=Stereobalanus canadensis TaxID=560612 RepID=A0A3Q8HDX0_9BILA|nr:NADH dehydrogenase subunit 2 [Stereobalanus canadensis]AXY64122.1 NADH dehydrogenase subunit 2 [Stereobalanus canadensis]